MFIKKTATYSLLLIITIKHINTNMSSIKKLIEDLAPDGEEIDPEEVLTLISLIFHFSSLR